MAAFIASSADVGSRSRLAGFVCKTTGVDGHFPAVLNACDRVARTPAASAHVTPATTRFMSELLHLHGYFCDARTLALMSESRRSVPATRSERSSLSTPLPRAW